MKRLVFLTTIAFSTLLSATLGIANPGKGNKDKEKVTAAHCKDVVAKLETHGRACLEVKVFKDRGVCFDHAPKKAGINADHLKTCGERGDLDALKNKLIAEEKIKYPQQPETYEKKEVPAAAVAAAQQSKPALSIPVATTQAVVPAPPAPVEPKPAPLLAQTNAETPPTPKPIVTETPRSLPSIVPGVAIAAARIPSVVPTTAVAPAIVPVAAPASAVVPVAVAAPASATVPVAVAASAAVPAAASAASAPAAIPAGPYQWPASQCNPPLSKFKTMGNRCLASSDFNARNNCFNSANASMPSGFLTNCSLSVAPVKSQLMAEEKSRYPTQQNAVH